MRFISSAIATFLICCLSMLLVAACLGAATGAGPVTTLANIADNLQQLVNQLVVTLQPIFGNWQVQVQNELSNLSSDQQIQVKDEALPKLPDGGEIRVEGS